ncbi:MAG: sortase domain-bontaining protein [Clostridia bacterium]
MSGFENTYYIYSIYETDANDTSCLNQETFGQKEITLITCNNLNLKRLIVKARQI